MKRRLSLILALALLPAAADAQLESRTYIRDMDADSPSFTYCQSGLLTPGNNKLQTSGSSTTVTAVAGTPFDPLAVGDTINVTVAGVEVFRRVATKTSGASITINAAADFSAGHTFDFRKVSCGTTATFGWIDVGSYAEKAFTIEYNQGDLTGGLDWRVECQAGEPGAAVKIIYPSAEGDSTCDGGAYEATDVNCNFATADIGVLTRTTLVVFEPYKRCRVGIKVGTSDSSDAGANIELVSIFLDAFKAVR